MAKKKSKNSIKSQVVWKLKREEFTLGSEKYIFKPLHSKQVGSVISFLKKNYPNLYQSYFNHYLKKEFYQKEVALLDRWSSHKTSKSVLFYIVENAKTQKICAQMSGARDDFSPLFLSHISTVDKKLRYSKMFETQFHLMRIILEESAIEHVACMTTALVGAPQKVFLREGMTVCGIDLAAEMVELADGTKGYVPDIYFHIFLNQGKRKMIPESKWQLVPEAQKMWDTIKEIEKNKNEG